MTQNELIQKILKWANKVAPLDTEFESGYRFAQDEVKAMIEGFNRAVPRTAVEIDDEMRVGR